MTPEQEQLWESNRKLMDQMERQVREDTKRHARFQHELKMITLKMTLGSQLLSKRLMGEAGADLEVLKLRHRNGEFSRRTTQK